MCTRCKDGNCILIKIIMILWIRVIYKYANSVVKKIKNCSIECRNTFCRSGVKPLWKWGVFSAVRFYHVLSSYVRLELDALCILRIFKKTLWGVYRWPVASGKLLFLSNVLYYYVDFHPGRLLLPLLPLTYISSWW